LSLLEVGRICVKKTGRESGKQCVVIDIIDKNFVLVTGPKDVTGVRRRKANIDHLEPTDLKIGIKRDSEDGEISKALEKLNITKPEKKVKRRSKQKKNETVGETTT